MREHHRNTSGGESRKPSPEEVNQRLRGAIYPFARNDAARKLVKN
jgi:hypothetical protein